MKVDLRPAKASASQGLEPGQPGREMLAALPDEVDASEFDVVAPTLLRLLRARGPG
jgi:hypothetical protein